LSGVARVLDPFGGFDAYNDSTTSEEADTRAMYSDWRMVGHDLDRAIVCWRDGPGKRAHQPALFDRAEYATLP
jgi:hypothetical protein